MEIDGHGCGRNELGAVHLADIDRHDTLKKLHEMEVAQLPHMLDAIRRELGNRIAMQAKEAWNPYPERKEPPVIRLDVAELLESA